MVLEKWYGSFKDLLNPTPTEIENVDEFGEQQESIDISFENSMSLLEINKVLSHMKIGKASGIDEILLEALKNDGLKCFMFKHFNLCFEKQVFPSLWHKSIINSIPKNSTSDQLEPSNYRGMSLVCAMYKVYCGVLNNRLVTWADINGLIIDEQNGFRSGRSTLNHLLSLTSIIETRKLKRLDTYVAFIDLSKAYDRINRTMLWKRLYKNGLSNKMLQVLQVIYSNVECCVCINGFDTQWFRVKTGLKQTCLISPIPFNLYINDLAIEIKHLNKGIIINGECVSLLMYADDICLVASSERELQEMLHVLKSWCDKWHMSLNTDKTEIIHFCTQSHSRIQYVFRYGDYDIKLVPLYKYLGLVLNEHLDYQLMAKVVVKSAKRELGFLIAKSKVTGGMPYDVFTKLYNALVQPLVEYEAGVLGTGNL